MTICGVTDNDGICSTVVPVPGGAKGLCGKHYQRFKRHGNVEIVNPHGYRGGTPEQYFFNKVDKNGPTPALRPELGPCWVWTGAQRGLTA